MNGGDIDETEVCWRGNLTHEGASLILEVFEKGRKLELIGFNFHIRWSSYQLYFLNSMMDLGKVKARKQLP